MIPGNVKYYYRSSTPHGYLISGWKHITKFCNIIKPPMFHPGNKIIQRSRCIGVLYSILDNSFFSDDSQFFIRFKSDKYDNKMLTKVKTKKFLLYPNFPFITLILHEVHFEMIFHIVRRRCANAHRVETK